MEYFAKREETMNCNGDGTFDFIADGTFCLWQTGIDSERAKTQRPGWR